MLPWVIAALAVLAAAIGIGVIVVDGPNQPEPARASSPPRETGGRSHNSLRRANPDLRPFLSTMMSL